MKIVILGDASSIHIVKWVNGLASISTNEIYLFSIHEFSSSICSKVKPVKLKTPPPLGYFLSFLEVKRKIRIIQPDIVNTHYATGYGYISRLVNFKTTLLSVWGSDVFSFPYKSKFHMFFLKKNLLSPIAIASTSHSMLKQVNKLDSSLTVFETPFGIDVNKFRKINDIEHDEIIIGTVKTLKPIYGIDIFLESVAILYHDYAIKNVKVLIAGIGPDLDSLKLLASELNISDVVDFVGYINNDKVPEFLNSLDVFVALSREESFGVAALEAGSCCLPSVVSEAHGLKEVVIDNYTGFVVPINDSQAAAEKLYELAVSKNLRSTLGMQAREHICSKYSNEQVLITMMNTYQKVIESSYE